MIGHGKDWLTKLCEDAHVSTLKANSRLQQSNDLIKVATLLVELRYFLKIVGIHNDIEATQLCQSELCLLNTSIAHLQAQWLIRI